MYLQLLILKRKMIFLLFLFISLTGYSLNSYSTNLKTTLYVADLRPNNLSFLVLTESAGILSGYKMDIVPDQKGSTKSKKTLFQGQSDKKDLSIVLATNPEKTVVIGKVEGDIVELFVPTTSGNIQKYIFKSTTQERYNELLEHWQKELAAAHERKLFAKKEIEREQTALRLEKEALTKLSDKLYDAINRLKESQIQADFDHLVELLANEKETLLHLESLFFTLQSEANVKPMTCYQAFNSLVFIFSNQMVHAYEVSMRNAFEMFRVRLASVEERLSRVQEFQHYVTSTVQGLESALRKSRYKEYQLKARPGEEKETLEKYLSRAAHVRTELIKVIDEHKILHNSARDLMRRGETVLKETQSTVRC